MQRPIAIDLVDDGPPPMCKNRGLNAQMMVSLIPRLVSDDSPKKWSEHDRIRFMTSNVKKASLSLPRFVCKTNHDLESRFETTPRLILMPLI